MIFRFFSFLLCYVMMLAACNPDQSDTDHGQGINKVKQGQLDASGKLLSQEPEESSDPDNEDLDNSEQGLTFRFDLVAMRDYTKATSPDSCSGEDCRHTSWVLGCDDSAGNSSCVSLACVFTSGTITESRVPPSESDTASSDFKGSFVAGTITDGHITFTVSSDKAKKFFHNQDNYTMWVKRVCRQPADFAPELEDITVITKGGYLGFLSSLGTISHATTTGCTVNEAGSCGEELCDFSAELLE
ncbi:MAG: hypothetical protein OXC40_06945 [Proteobacteria bacterium]|nr:hypothetical protein [Pseudomonadota bacterium]